MRRAGADGLEACEHLRNLGCEARVVRSLGDGQEAIVATGRRLQNQLADHDGVSFGGQLGATYIVNNEGLALHLMLEETSNRITRSALRVIFVLDMAFNPET